MATLRDVRRLLVEVSRQHSRVTHEAEDLAHDIILSALRRGLPLDDEAFIRSANGAARLHGAFLARSAGRRRAREMGSSADYLASAGVDARDDGVGVREDGVEPTSVLPPALQTTLLLLVSGLEKSELCAALGVTDAALRKRFQALRAHAPLARPEQPVAARSPSLLQLRKSQVQLLPRLASKLAGEGGARRTLAVADPDGHGLIFAEVLTNGRRTATTGVPAPTLGR